MNQYLHKAHWKLNFNRRRQLQINLEFLIEILIEGKHNLHVTPYALCMWCIYNMA